MTILGRAGARNRRRTAVLTLLASSILLLGNTSADAAITSPANGATVEGGVQISESVGGYNGCGSGWYQQPATEFAVRNASGATVAYFYDYRYPSGGPRTQVWQSDTRYGPDGGTPYWPNGAYTIQSLARNTYLQWYSSGWSGYYVCYSSSPYVISSVTVTVRNWDFNFTDDNGSGRIGLNVSPTKEFIFRPSDGSSSIVKQDPTIELYSLPSDVQADLSCASGEPLTCVPQPPAEATLCTGPTSGCKPRLARIAFDDADLAIAGLFDLKTKAFGAIVHVKGPQSSYALSHAPTCAYDPLDGSSHCASDPSTLLERCVNDPTAGTEICADASGVPSVPPVPTPPPPPPPPTVPCVFNPTTGEPICPPA